MDSYCDINNAYINKGILSSGDLEKRARQINNNKRSKSKDVYRNYRKTANVPNNISSNNISSNNNLMSNDELTFNTFAQFLANKADKGTNINNFDKISNGFYTAQGDYLENGSYQQDNTYNPESSSGTLIQDIIAANDNSNKKAIRKHKYRSMNKKIYDEHTLDIDTPSSESLDSLSTDESNSTDSSNSSITWDIKDIDKQIKTKSKFDSKKRSKRHKCIDFDLNSVDSLESLDSGESLLRHIRFCTECKNKVIDLIRKNKTSNKNNSDTNNKLLNEIRNLNLSHKIIDQMSKSSIHIDPSLEFTDTQQKTKNQKNDTHIISKSTESYIPEIKEIITVCLIAFLIIMVLDLLMRSK